MIYLEHRLNVNLWLCEMVSFTMEAGSNLFQLSEKSLTYYQFNRNIIEKL